MSVCARIENFGSLLSEFREFCCFFSMFDWMTLEWLGCCGTKSTGIFVPFYLVLLLSLFVFYFCYSMCNNVVNIHVCIHIQACMCVFINLNQQQHLFHFVSMCIETYVFMKIVHMFISILNRINTFPSVLQILANAHKYRHTYTRKLIISINCGCNSKFYR